MPERCVPFTCKILKNKPHKNLYLSKPVIKIAYSHDLNGEIKSSVCTPCTSFQNKQIVSEMCVKLSSIISLSILFFVCVCSRTAKSFLLLSCSSIFNLFFPSLIRGKVVTLYAHTVPL